MILDKILERNFTGKGWPGHIVGIIPQNFEGFLSECLTVYKTSAASAVTTSYLFFSTITFSPFFYIIHPTILGRRVAIPLRILFQRFAMAVRILP